MILIPQQKRTDCGVACAAMLAGVSYDEAAAVFSKRGATNEATMARALRALGLQARLPMIPGPANGRNALLKCNRGQRRVANVKGWHWCVWDASTQTVLDPVADGVARPILSHMPAHV